MRISYMHDGTSTGGQGNWAVDDGEGFYSTRARARPMNERKAMLTSQAGLSVTRQCQLLAVPRSSAYARAQPVSSIDLAFMRLLDELYLK